ncbi:MAG: hypothetical protein J5845_08945 [Lachnospiraceae bacterium]|nr:hypothetical protein [Lachnospiraceae bacterium]
MKKPLPIRIIAIVLTVVLTAGLLAGCGRKADNGKNNNQNNQNQQQGPGGNSTDVPEGYVKVTFALPADATDREKEYTTLPAEAVVKAGTSVAELEKATRMSSLFLGYTYDEAGTSLAEETDTLSASTTLYPRFALKEGMQDGGSFNYVARKDVPEDFAFELVSYGLSEKQIRELLTLDNASLQTTDLPYVLTSTRVTKDKKWIADKGFDETMTAKIWALIEKEQELGDAFNLLKELSLLVDPKRTESSVYDERVLEIVGKFAPSEFSNETFLDEKDENGNTIDPTKYTTMAWESVDTSEMDPETKALVESLMINLDTATEEDIKKCFGVAEDDSLQRFWREDMDLSVNQVNLLENLLLNRKPEGTVWELRSEKGHWDGGYLYSLMISDTSKLRFMYDDAETDPEVNEYNITIHQDEVVNMSIADHVKYISADQVEGVAFVSILDLDTDEDGNLIAKENMGSGTMTYNGSDKLKKGDVIAVNKGTVKERGFTDGDVTYIKVKKDLGNGRYEYENASVADIVAIPDLIPVPDDGSIEDGVIKIAKSAMNFGSAAFKKYELTADTTVDEGDYLAFYKGTLGANNCKVTGYGQVTKIEKTDAGITASYMVITEETMFADEKLLYMQMPEVDFELSEADEAELEKSMREQIMSSGIVSETSDFLTALVLGKDEDIDSLEYAEQIRNMTIKSEDGDMTLDDLRKLSDGAKKVEVSDVKVTFLCGLDLQHYAGKKGVRAEVAVSFTITITIMEAGKLEIQPVIALEQEFLLTPTIHVVRHKNKIGLTSSLDVTASLQAGTYSGFGVMVTAKTKQMETDKSKSWEELVGDFASDNKGAEMDEETRKKRQAAAKALIKGGNKLLEKAEKQEKKGQGMGTELNQNGQDKSGKDSQQGYLSSGIGGDLPTKYSSMLSNDAQYINLVDVTLASLDIPVDPLNIVHVGMKIKFIVGLKINAAIGAGISYANAKEYSYTFRAKIWGGGDEMGEKRVGDGASVKDVETPNFRADFYAFGMLGVKVGVSLDLRVGLFSTDLDSVGVVATAGLYAELYGFLYCWYEWTSGKGTTSGAMGSLLFEIGIYADISIKIQVGMGRASKSWSLYSKKTPLIQLGCVEYPIEMLISPKDPSLTVEIPNGQNTVKVPDDLFKVKLMALSTGKVTDKSMDSKKVNDTNAKTFTVATETVGYDEKDVPIIFKGTRTWTQSNEEHFVVECFDLTGKDGKVKAGASSFQYLPATNEIYVCPVDSNTDEVYGKVVFTFMNTAFGFSTQKLQRTVYVHWKGTQRTAKVEYYLQDDANVWNKWNLVGTGAVSGYDGIECYVYIDEKITAKFPGYKLYYLGYPDESELKEKREAALKVMKEAEGKKNTAYNDYMLYKYSAKPDKKRLAELQKISTDAECDWMAKRNIYSAYQRLLEKFCEQNQKAIDNQEGETRFTMRGTETVIRILYRKLEKHISWDIFDENNLNPDVRDWSLCSSEWNWNPDNSHGWDYHPDCERVLVGLPVMDYIPERLSEYRKDSYTTEWYMYDFTVDWYYNWGETMRQARNEGLAALRRGDYSHLTKVDANTKVPDKYIVMIGVQYPKEFTVTFKNGNTVVSEFKTLCGRPINLPDGSGLKKTGMKFSHWQTANGEAIDKNTKMPEHDTTYYAAFVGNTHNVNWVVDGYVEKITTIRTGELLYMKVPDELNRENYQMLLRTAEALDSPEYPYEFVAPDKDFTVYVRYTLGNSKITWTEDGKDIRTDIVEIGTTPTAPTLKAREGLDLVWMIDGKVMDTTYVMPKGDVVANAYWHVHDWTGQSVTIEATCARTGLAGYTCALCGLVKDGVELPIEPDRHNWEEIVLTTSTCSTHGDMLRRCLWCHKEEHVELPFDSTVHGESYREEGTPATCVTDGFSGNYRCKDCDAIVGEGFTIPAHGNHVSDRTSVIVKDRTCVTDGYRAEHCLTCGKELNIIPIPAADLDECHDWGEWIVTKEPTCAYGTKQHTCKLCHVTREESVYPIQQHDFRYTGNYKEGCCIRPSEFYYECSVCHEKKTEVAEQAADAERHEHLGTPVVTKQPGCFESGIRTRVCSDCGRSVEESIDPVGCDWGEPEYLWGTNNQTVTAKKTCKRDSSHFVTETVTADEAVLEPATCLRDGKTQYTSKNFTTDAAFVQQKKTVITQAFGHEWGSVGYEWSTDKKTVTAIRRCNHDSSHYETETANVTAKETKAPTYTDLGETTYTATFTNTAFGTWTKTLADIPVLDPVWSEVTVEMVENNTKMKASRYNKENPSQVQTETVAASIEKNLPATCEADGEIIYTATFTNTAFGTRKITVKQNKKGHKYTVDTTRTVNPERIYETSEYGDTYVKSWKAGTLVEVCENDNTHVKETPLLVDLALVCEAEEAFSKVEDTYVLDLTEMIDPAEINDTNTVLKICYSFFGAMTYSGYTDAEHENWYYNTASEYFEKNMHRLIIDFEEASDGIFVVDKNISLAKIAEENDGEYTFTLTIKPDKSDLYKETSYKVTIKLPNNQS